MGIKYSHPNCVKRGVDFLDIALKGIGRDCPKRFIGGIRDQQFTEFYHYAKVYTSECPRYFVRRLFRHRAVNCVSSMLQGEARFNFNVNVPWAFGLPPLHLAARMLSFDLTKVFLLHGARPDLRSHGHDASIPLCFALDALSCQPCVTDWTVEKSPSELVHIFCDKELREALNTIKLLASRTENLHKISLLYAMNGEVIQLTALLILAWDKLVAPYTKHGVEFSPIGQCIKKELKLLADGEQISTHHNLRKSKLESTWKMLNLLDKTYDRIEEYLYQSKDAEIPNSEVPLEVQHTIDGHKDDVYSGDDTQCSIPELKLEEEVLLNQSFMKPMLFEPSAAAICEQGVDFIDLARQAIPKDCQKSFISAIRDQQLVEYHRYGKVCTTECPSEFFRLILEHRAVNCATGILQGEARFNVDLNAAWIDGLPPLHFAAQNLSFDLAKLFLLYGANPNLPCHGDGDAKVPLCLALEALSCNPSVTDWTVKISPLKLIYILCIKELRESLDTIKLLASKTKNLHKICLQYAEKGEVAQLTALLLVAWDKLMAPYVKHGVEFSPVGQCIYKELVLLSDQQFTGKCCFLRSKLESAWKIISVLEESHDRIEDYIYRSKDAEILNYDVPLDVAYMIRDRVKLDEDEDLFCDDVPCLKPALKPEEEDKLRRDLDELMASGPVAQPASVIADNLLVGLGFRASHSFHTCSNHNSQQV